MVAIISLMETNMMVNGLSICVTEKEFIPHMLDTFTVEHGNQARSVDRFLCFFVSQLLADAWLWIACHS